MFDIKLDTKVKDWVFDANRDLAGVSGIDVVQQRMMTRLFIQRGGFLYDTDGNLGSRLYDLLSSSRPNLAEEIEIMVAEALQPMTDITVEDVRVSFKAQDDPRETLVHLDIAINPSIFGGFDTGEAAPISQSVTLILP